MNVISDDRQLEKVIKMQFLCVGPRSIFLLEEHIYLKTKTYLNNNLRKHPNPRQVATWAVYVTVI